MHEQLRWGTTIEINKPRNNFALDEQAGVTLLVAGGIGITPMLCMYRRLRQTRQPVCLVDCVRSRSQAAFLGELDALGGDVRLHFDDKHEGRRSISPPFSLDNMKASTHIAADRVRC